MAAYQNDQPESELTIGLVTAVRTETSLVTDLLRECLGRAGYDVFTVKISKDVIPLLVGVPVANNDHFARIGSLMDAGNEARAKADDDSVLALGATTRIFAKREKNEDESGQALCKTAVIIDSLKRPEEVETLRRVYPSGFILMGIHEEESRRLLYLTASLGMTKANALKLIERDSEESKVEHGQRVNKTFHLADFFVRISESHDRLRFDIKRIVELWFGNPFITPTFDEHAMFMAFAAGLRSADLSRQVGAVVTQEDMQILATGANDCPRAGGGLYWPMRQKNGGIDDMPNGRDYTRLDGDSNRAEQNRIIEQIVTEGKSTEYDLDSDKLRRLLEKSRIRELTEYGRVVHAEMEAMLSCARCGASTVGATPYCTTFPCHNCAKHIIAAGMKRVVYVEPYSKSKTREFHDDSIATGKQGEVGNLVEFSPFVGIGPRRFFDLFSMQLGSTYPLVRKDNNSGKRVEWHIESAQLRIQMNPVSYLDLEAQACAMFGTKAGKKPD
jgi:deoxycytidylate deaminase